MNDSIQQNTILAATTTTPHQNVSVSPISARDHLLATSSNSNPTTITTSANDDHHDHDFHHCHRHQHQHQHQQHDVVLTTVTKKSRSETAWSWFQRYQQKRIQKENMRAQEHQILTGCPPRTPLEAAWAFFGPTAVATPHDNRTEPVIITGGTGISFVDESFRRHNNTNNNNSNNINRSASCSLPALELNDYYSNNNHKEKDAYRMTQRMGATGKTRILLSLAARFVTSTRPCLFANNSRSETAAAGATAAAAAAGGGPLPVCLFLDSTMDCTSLALAHAVSSMLIRQSSLPSLPPKQQQQQQQQNDEAFSNNDSTGNNQALPSSSSLENLEDNIASCLARIHLAHVDDPREWVAVLESIRGYFVEQQQQHQQQYTHTTHKRESFQQQLPPILLLWDGLYSEPDTTIGIRKEIARQLTLLVQECPVGFIYTTTTNSTSAYRHSNKNSNNMTTTAFDGNASTIICSQKIQLRCRNDTLDSNGHLFVATIGGAGGNRQQQIPYSLSAAGVLP